LTSARLLLSIIAAYVTLAIGYIDSTPYRTSGYLPFQTEGRQKDIGAPDEWQHTNYVRFLVEERRFPVFGDAGYEFFDHYQAHQPPMYYLLCAPVAAVVGHANEDAEKWGLRLVNVALGALMVLAVHFTLLKFTGNSAVAICAAALLSMLPMFLALSTAVTNDVLLYLLMVLGVGQCAAGLKDGWTARRCCLLGVILGAAVLTKSTGLFLVPVAFFAMLWWKDGRASAGGIALAAGVALAICGPWLARNVSLYGDPLAMRAFQDAFHTLPASTIIERDGAVRYWVEAVGYRAIWSFWGIFGYFQISFPVWVYWSLTGVAGGLGIGWLASLRTASSFERKMHWLNLVLLSAVVIAFVKFNAVYYQAQARYLYPAALPIVSALAIGAAHLTGRRPWIIIAPLLAALFAANLFAIIDLLPTSFYLLENYDKLQAR
jgi:4-amino-4-deoxy-L-arabinose transferase-like glycosyltransferase